MKKNAVGFLASALAILCAAVTANAYVSDNFNGQADGAAPLVSLGWAAPSGVIVSNGIGSQALYIPILSTISNSHVVATNKVWTDFYTIPRPFVSDSGTAPAIDTNATAQFFVNSSGLWVTISGNWPSATKTTVCDTVYGGGVYPTVTLYSAYYHVSVLHDYVARDWSLFVNDMPIATNLQFINSGVTAHDWFQVQNLGGSSTNVCLLDDFLVTNKMATTGSGNAITNVVPNTDIPVADALAYFGTVDDPRKTNETIGAVGAGVSLAFSGGAGSGSYVMYGTRNYDLTGLSSNGVLAGNSFTDSDVLSGSTNRYFYKLVTIGADGHSLTNDETYAAYRQTLVADKYFILGVPVNLGDQTNRTMAGVMGDQLISGLNLNDVLTISAYNATNSYKVVAGPEWFCTVGDDNKGTNQWPQGIGMVVKRGAGGAPTSYSYFAGLKETNVVNVVIPDNRFTYLAWPYDDSTFNNTALGIAATEGDFLYIQTNGAVNYISARYKNSAWRRGPTGAGDPLALTLRAGDGIIYKTVGGDKTFIPVVVP